MTNSKPQIKIVDVTTGEEIIRDANAEELAQIAADQLLQDAKQAEAEAKATARQALLSKLGITQEEARILLGGN
jgi:hypothetical protein